jgi:HK97 family phage major capsid protein
MSDEIKAAAEAVIVLNKGFDEFKNAYDARLSEMEAKGHVDPLIDEKIKRIEASMDVAQKTADEAVLSAKRASRVMTDGNGHEVDLDAKALAWARVNAKRHGSDVGTFGASELDAYRRAMDTYMRKGDRAISDQEHKALSVGTDPDGGYVVHPDMSGAVVKKVYETSPMRAYASIQVISTDSLEGLFDLGEAGAGWVGETDARDETDTPQLGRWSIPVHELYAKPKASQKILDDAAINMEAWLAEKVSERFARKEASAFVLGTGIAMPRGFMTYADGTTVPGSIEQFATGVNGGLPAAPAGGDTLISALYGLKAQYRANATWFMNRATTTLVRKAKDTDGAYIWQPGIAAGQPASLLGYPVASFEDMASPASGSLSIAVGDMRAAYQIVDRMGIRTLRDPYSAKPHVEFYTTKRVGGDVLNFEAIKVVRFGA